MAEQMKPSGIDWIGDIPESWDVVRIKDIGTYRNGLTYAPEDITEDDNGTLVLRSSNIQNGKISYDDNVYVKCSVSPELMVKKGDIIICSRNGSRELIGKNAIIENSGLPCSFGAFMMVYRCSCPRYMYYILNSEVFSYYLGTFLTSTINQLTGNNFGNMKIVFCKDHNEQKKIVDFLDKECARIDSIAADLEKQIALLQQYKKSLITETVTKGLDKSVPMKDSGVEWIGKIPNTWDCKKMKYVISEPLQYGANEAGDDYKEDYPRYIRITDITEENSLKDDGKLSLSPDIAKPYLLKDGDLLFARSGATVGKTFYYTSNYGTCAFAGYLIKARFNQDKMNPKFVYYTTLGIGYENWKNTVFTQATIQNIGADKYAQLYITVPSMKEQNEIIAYLDTQCKAIDDVIHSKYQQLSTIQEHKKSLIYEYVTGKKTSEGGAVRWPSKQGN